MGTKSMFTGRDSNDAREIGLIFIGVVVWFAYVAGPVKWRSTGGTGLLQSHLHGCQVWGWCSLSVAALLVIGKSIDHRMLRLAHALGVGVYTIPALVFLYACRPGGESTAGPAGAAAYLFIAYQHYQAALDRPGYSWCTIKPYMLWLLDKFDR